MARSHQLRSYITTVLLLGFFLLTLGACAGGTFNTAASMRIEVEVYKGPLLKTTESQWGELIGLIEETSDSLTVYNDSLMLIAAYKGFVSAGPKPPEKNCPKIPEGSYPYLGIDPHYRPKKLKNKSPIPPPEIDTRVVAKVGGSPIHPEKCTRVVWCQEKSVENSIKKLGMIKISECTLMAGIHSDVRLLLEHIDDLKKTINDGQKSLCGASDSYQKYAKKYAMCSNDIVKLIAQLSIKMKTKAMYWAQAHVTAAAKSRGVRIAMANFSNLAAELSNQIQSRVDALSIQLIDGIDRERLPLSTFLQNAKATDFLNLYTWNRASAPATYPEMLLHPIHAFSSDETADRVRVVERLFADHHWAKVNTVYASGLGDVRMALIKDDIGNWNLKSFDADPSELVEAYTKLTRAGLKTATELITDAAKQGVGSAALDTALNTASRLGSGRIGTGGPKTPGFDVLALRQRTIQRLQELKIKSENERNAIEDRIVKTTEEIETQEGKVNTLQAETEKTPEINESEGPEKIAQTAREDAKTARRKKIESEMKAEKLQDDDPAKADIKNDAEKAKRNADEAETSAETALDKLKVGEDATQDAKDAATAAAKAQAWAEVALAKAELAELAAERDVATRDKEEHPKKIIQQARRILRDYAAVIDALQEGAVAPHAVGAGASKQNGIQGTAIQRVSDELDQQ